MDAIVKGGKVQFPLVLIIMNIIYVHMLNDIYKF
jgi:hypothetical protein